MASVQLFNVCTVLPVADTVMYLIPGCFARNALGLIIYTPVSRMLGPLHGRDLENFTLNRWDHILALHIFQVGHLH